MISFSHEDGDLEGLAEGIAAEAVGDAAEGVTLAAVHLESSVKRKLDGARSGRIYRVPGTQVDYQASAPGEPPAKMLGELQQSIQRTATEIKENEVSARVGVSEQRAAAAKARILELGGVIHHPNGAVIRIEPRPYLRPTFEEQEEAVDAILMRAMP